MQIVLSILLYLNVISSNSTYTGTYIHNAIYINHARIVGIKADKQLLNTIIQTYSPNIKTISILDDGQLKYSDTDAGM